MESECQKHLLQSLINAANRYSYLEAAIEENNCECILLAINNILSVRLNNSVTETSFFEGIKYSMLFAQHHDNNPNAPKDTEIDNYLLGKWQANQRQKMRKKQLLVERISILENIGFNWFPKHGGHNKA